MIRRFLMWLTGADKVLKIAKQVNWQPPTERPKTLERRESQRGSVSLRRAA